MNHIEYILHKLKTRLLLLTQSNPSDVLLHVCITFNFISVLYTTIVISQAI